jgi:transcriptional regulator with XRE-family HTH domain
MLCELMEQKGWSQKRLGDEADMLEPMVSRIIHANANCTFETAGRLLFALGLRADDVVLCQRRPFSRADTSTEPYDWLVGAAATDDTSLDLLEGAANGKEAITIGPQEVANAA